jgi:hypothetical protein
VCSFGKEIMMWTSGRAWESIRENMKASATEGLGYHELKQHKPWSDEECSKIVRSKDKDKR